MRTGFDLIKMCEMPHGTLFYHLHGRVRQYEWVDQWFYCSPVFNSVRYGLSSYYKYKMCTSRHLGLRQWVEIKLVASNLGAMGKPKILFSNIPLTLTLKFLMILLHRHVWMVGNVRNRQPTNILPYSMSQIDQLSTFLNRISV